MADKKGGILDEVTWDGTEESVCSNRNSDWRLYSGVYALGSSEEEWSQIEDNGSNIWRFAQSFSNLPESTYPLDDRKDSFDYRPWPDNFQYDVSIAYDEDVSNLYLNFPSPDDSESGNNYSEFDLLLDILGGAGGFWVNAGAAAIEYVIGPDDATVTVADLGESISWDIPMDGSDYSDLPQERSSDATGAEVRARVNNEYSSGTHELSVTQSFTYDYYTQYDPVYDSCDPTYRYVASRTSATTKSLTPTYDVA